jgi:hypothetical protein
VSEPGQWEAKLGWLGSFLTGQNAHRIEILNRETFVTAAWDEPGGSRQEASFSGDDLARSWVPYKAVTHPAVLHGWERWGTKLTERSLKWLRSTKKNSASWSPVQSVGVTRIVASCTRTSGRARRRWLALLRQAPMTKPRNSWSRPGTRRP